MGLRGLGKVCICFINCRWGPRWHSRSSISSSEPKISLSVNKEKEDGAVMVECVCVY